MPKVHKICKELATEGLIHIEQKKVRVLDFSNFGGVYRIRTAVQVEKEVSTPDISNVVCKTQLYKAARSGSKKTSVTE